jgi:hypothetical protein
MKSANPVAAVALLAHLGCGQAIDVPLPFQSPPIPVDVDAATAASIEAACTDPAAESCQGIAAICAADAGAPCNPVVLPARIPTEVEGEDTTALLGDTLADAMRPSLSIYANPGAELPDTVDKERISAVTITDVAVAFTGNTLTFDVPVMDVYVGDSETGDDVDGRIASGALRKVGVLGQSTDDDVDFEVGLLAGTDAEVPLSFVEGGNAILNEAFQSLAFEFVLHTPDGNEVTLKPDPDDATKLITPAGRVDASLKADLSYRVSASDLPFQ